MKIKQKLVCGFVGVALLVGVVGYLAVNASRKGLQKSIGESSIFLAGELLDKIDRGLYNKIERFQSFQDPILLETVIKSNQEFENLDDIHQYIDEKDKEWTSAPQETVTPFMNDLIDNELSKALRKRTGFYEEKYGFRVFAEVFVTNKYGANVGQTGKTTDYRQDDEEWWQVAKKDGLYVADVEYDRSAGVYSTDIGVRIDDEAGNLLGVIKVVLNIEEVINNIKEAEAAIGYEHQEIHLLNKDGKIIYAKYHRPFEDISNKKYFKETTGNKGYFITKAHHVGEGNALYCYARSKGYKDFKGLGWIMLVEYDEEEVFAPVAKLRNSIVIISLTVTTLAVLLGLFISTSISKPVTKLKDAAAKIGKGNLDIQIEIKSNDEISELAASFNAMGGKLRKSHAQLEEKVQERTAELSSANAKLEGEIEQRTAAQKTLEERIKELNCLFALSRIVEQPGISLEQILQETTNLLRNAYQHPDKICVRVTFEGVRYKTDNFEKSEFSQYAQIKIHGEKAGTIEVYYLGEEAESDESPFIKEERDLLDAVAEHLGRIAERKKTGEKLQLFRDLIDRSNDNVFVIEPKWGRFLDVNNKACETLGYTQEELLNMSVKDIDETIPDDSDWTEHIKEVRKKGYIVLESRHKHKDSTTFPVEINVKLITQEKEEFIIAVARDITERKQAAEKLAAERNKLQAIMAVIEGGITIQDREYNIIYQNRFLEDKFGGLGEKCYRVYEGKEKVCEGCPVEKAFRDGTFYTAERKVVMPNGEIVYWDNTASPIMDAAGEVVSCVELARDITERKRVEERQDELLEKVERINKELKDFAYIVSHDLKAPLRGIKTLADWLSTDYADRLDDKGREQMSLLGNRVDRMHNLIDGVLEYSRIGRTEEKPVQVNLNDLIPTIIDTIAPPENIAITIENELPVIKCDQTRILQIFQNLLSNAIKYMDKPQGQIRISCVEEDGFWRFSVADNGPGIEEKHFDKIFQIFQTLSPRDEFESTGVGLSVVKKIVELYGGKIWVESKAGEGSTFFFTLPKQEKEMGVKNAKLETNITC